MKRINSIIQPPLRLALFLSLKAMTLAGNCGALTTDQQEAAEDILAQSTQAERQQEPKHIDVVAYQRSPFWKKLMDLGKSITNEDLATLSVKRQPTLTEEIAAISGRCFRDEAKIQPVLDYYTSLVPNGPRAVIDPPLRAEDTEAEDREMWEATLLSPPIFKARNGGTIAPRKCADALAAIGDPRSMQVLTFARKRLIVGEVRVGRWENPSTYSIVDYAANAKEHWITPLAKMGRGTPEGLHALLEALRLCEAEHPALLSLKGLGLDLHPDQKGVADTLTEMVFVQKTSDGKWLWKDAIEELPEKERTSAVTEVLRIARENFAMPE